MGPIKDLWDEGNVAIFSGTGYPSPDRSHFRSMDIWHTAEPETLSSEGWLGRTIRELDPDKHNVVTGVSFGPALSQKQCICQGHLRYLFPILKGMGC
ncbi:MAG: hypothetical protein CM1200mP3_11770 [Chloroflexota bacterium]|nr:MAG: hypothetical protein CM1200mP3_11770 [Chloroflexota bacterium]